MKAATDYLKPELVRDGVSRFRVLGAELAVSRPKNRAALPQRQIKVLVIDYLNGRNLRVMVEQDRVAEVRTLDHQPAISSAEVEEAVELAGAVPGLRRLAHKKGVFTSAYAPGRQEPGTRYVGLYFLSARRDGRASILGSAEIDLVEQRVLAAHLPGERSAVPAEGGTHGKLR